MANAPAVERSSGLIEIAMVASDRFGELVADANPIASAQLGRFARAAWCRRPLDAARSMLLILHHPGES